MKKASTLISCLIFLACNKDSGNASTGDYGQNLTAGTSKKWVLREIQVGSTKVTDCRIGDIYEYKADNNLVIDVIHSLCDPSIIDPKRYLYGTWDFFSNNDSIKWNFPPVETHYKIASLTPNYFELKADVSVTDTLGNFLGIQTFAQIFTPY